MEEDNKIINIAEYMDAPSKKTFDEFYKTMTTLRKELYDDSWKSFREDQIDRLEGKQYIFNIDGFVENSGYTLEETLEMIDKINRLELGLPFIQTIFYKPEKRLYEITSRGQVSIPANYREAMMDEVGDTEILIDYRDTRALCYPRKLCDEKSKDMKDKPKFDMSRIKYFEMDLTKPEERTGRFVIDKQFRKRVKADSGTEQVVYSGNGDFFIMWSPKEYVRDALSADVLEVINLGTRTVGALEKEFEALKQKDDIRKAFSGDISFPQIIARLKKLKLIQGVGNQLELTERGIEESRYFNDLSQITYR